MGAEDGEIRQAIDNKPTEMVISKDQFLAWKRQKGLDTLNPTLTIDGKIKLVGEYTETIGTCLAFSEKEVSAGENQTLEKLVEPVAKLHKILKFRLASLDNEDGETKTGKL